MNKTVEFNEQQVEMLIQLLEDGLTNYQSNTNKLIINGILTKVLEE